MNSSWLTADLPRRVSVSNQNISLTEELSANPVHAGGWSTSTRYMKMHCFRQVILRKFSGRQSWSIDILRWRWLTSSLNRSANEWTKRSEYLSKYDIRSSRPQWTAGLLWYRFVNFCGNVGDDDKNYMQHIGKRFCRNVYVVLTCGYFAYRLRADAIRTLPFVDGWIRLGGRGRIFPIRTTHVVYEIAPIG